MQFTTFALSALSIGSALAATTSSSATSPSASGMVTVHVVKVGNANGTLSYSPISLVAAAGDMVQFQFAPANHTVTQSTFDNPCAPISLFSNITGIYSGFMPVAATSTTTPTYTIMVNSSTTPIWLYCSQGKHCQNGMTMVINENTKANITRSLANFQALAAKATVNLPGTATSAGTSGTTSNTSTGTGSSGSGSGTSSSSSSTTSTGSKSTGSSSANTIRVGESLGMGGLLAVGMAILL